MLCRKEGRNYLILRDGERTPEKVNARRADEVVGRMERAFETIRRELKRAYDEDYELYSILSDRVFDYGTYGGTHDGKASVVENALYELASLKEEFASNDEFPTFEESLTLEDFGYKDSFYDRRIWEKVLRDDDETEVVEEIQRIDSDPLRRIRTTNWERTDYGKSSTSITYRKLPIGKKLAVAIANTARLKPPKRR